VYAVRFRIVTGWHSLRLTPDESCDDAEVERLDGWLNRRWFDTPANRREFRSLHPECSGWSWGRIGREPLPYNVVDSQRCLTARAG
jgi:hypothetical protein